MLKLFAWEPPTLAEARARARPVDELPPPLSLTNLSASAETQVRAKRAVELSALTRGALFGTVSTFLWGAAPIFVTVATFALFAAVSPDPLTAPKAFTSLTLVTLMRLTLDSRVSEVSRKCLRRCLGSV